MEKTFGNQISSILLEIEGAIIDFDLNDQGKPNYTEDAFRASIKIFASVLMDKMYNLQENEEIPLEERSKMAFQAGLDLKKLVKTYTDINTHKLF